MKKNLLVLLIGSIGVISIAAFTVSNSSTAHSYGMTQYTNSPPDGTGDCKGCHNSASPTAVVHFSATPAFGTGNTYVPGVVYTLSYNVTGWAYFGFDLEMINGTTATSTDAGTFGAALTNCQVVPKSGSVPTNVEHGPTAAIATANSATWKWTAPASGKVYLYSVALGIPGKSGSQANGSTVQYNLTLSPSPAGVTENTSNVSDVKMFPNPATDNVRLTYSLEKRSTVSVKLYDLQGRMVADLLNETLEAGEQGFDAALPSSLGKGIYTVNLSVDGIPTIKKLMIK